MFLENIFLIGKRSESQVGKGKVIVVGGGLAGLMATIKIAEAGSQLNCFHWFR